VKKAPEKMNAEAK
jgi:hypothetical protein